MLRSFLRRRSSVPVPPASTPAVASPPSPAPEVADPAELRRLQRAVATLRHANEELTTRLVGLEERLAWEASVTLYLDERTIETDDRLAQLTERLEARIGALEAQVAAQHQDAELDLATVASLNDLIELRSNQARLANEVARLSIDLRNEVVRLATHVAAPSPGTLSPLPPPTAPEPTEATHDADRWALTVARQT